MEPSKRFFVMERPWMKNLTLLDGRWFADLTRFRTGLDGVPAGSGLAHHEPSGGLRPRPPEVPCAKRAGFAQRCRSSTGRKFPAMEPSKRFFVMEHPWMKNLDVTRR